MKITAIEEQKKNKNRKSVFLDGAFAFGIDAFSLYALKLSEGDEIDEARLAEIKRTVLFEDAKAKAARLLSSRSYTSRDIRKKLLEYTGDEETADKTLVFLEEYKLVDDRDYAKRFAHDCLHLKKLGRRSIRMKLLEKGISVFALIKSVHGVEGEMPALSHEVVPPVKLEPICTCSLSQPSGTRNSRRFSTHSPPSAVARPVTR